MFNFGIICSLKLYMVLLLVVKFSNLMKLLRMIKLGNCYEYINLIIIKILW